MARDPNKPTRMDGIINNIPSVLNELGNRLEQTGRLREYSHATSKNPDKILENWMRPNQVVVDPMEYPVVNLSDFEGRGFVLGESDRAIANRRLEGIGDNPLAFPIDLNTGSNFIFHNPQVWSSGASPITKMFNQAVKLKDKTKQNPIMLPRLLGPQGVDFDKHVATTQLSYNLANAPTDTLKLQDDILRMFVPGWKSASDPASMAAFYELPADVRKKVQIKLDSLKNQDGLSLGNARVALTNPAYIDVPNQFLPAVAEIDVDGKITKNQNINYPFGLQGQGLGLLSEPLTANELVSPDGELSWGEKGLVRPQDTNFYFQRADTSGILDQAYLNRLSDAGVKFKSPGAVGIIAGTVATILGTGYSGQEVEAGVVDTAKKLVAADAKTTQRANTVNTAKSAAAYLKNQGASGKSLDYGAGHGINAKAMGFDETFEPFAGEGFTPTYTSGQDIPRGSYGQIVSTNVLNVIPPTDVIDGQVFRPRDMAVLNIGDALQDGGMAVIQTRSASAVNELKKSKTATPQDESGAFVTSRGSYQKGFTRPELQEYVQGVLGDGFSVEIVPAKDISAGSAVKVVKLSRSPSAQVKDPSSRNLLAGGTSVALGTGLLGASEESDASFVGAFSKLGASRADLKGMATKMEAEGLSPTEIREKTGWYKGAQDQKWRTELPNTNTKINLPDVDFAKTDETQIVMRLDDVVDDAELLSQYDVDVQDVDSGFNLGKADFDELDGWRTTGKLGNIQVVFDSEMPPGAGGYGGNTITVSALSSPEEMRAIILHEIQHAIQERELFAGGANPSTFEKDKFISDMWNESLEKRLADLDEEYLVKDQYGMSNLSLEDREARDNLRLMKMLADRFREESAKAGSDDPFKMYLASAGEVEARNVELRDRAMSPSGLLKVAPFETESVPSANQIFRPEDDPIERFKNIIDERYNSYRQPDPTLTLDDDFARMQQTADGGIINQMMAQNARSQQLAEYGDALKSRRKLESVSKMINKRLDSKGPLVGEIIARETENFTKLIVGLVPMIASPDSTFYQDVTQSKSLLGDPSEGYNTVMDTIAKGMQTYVLEPAKKALDYKGSDDKSVRQEIAETIQPAIDAYKTLPETVQEEVMPRLGYLGALVGSLYGFGLANKAKTTVRQGQSGEGVLGRFSPLEGELVDTPTPAIDVRKPAGLLQQKMLKSANNRSR